MTPIQLPTATASVTEAPTPTPIATVTPNHMPTATRTETPTSIEATGTLSISDDVLGLNEEAALTVTIHTAGGKPASAVLCRFRIVSQPGSDASVPAAPALTDAHGQSTATLYAGGTPGTIGLEVTCGRVVLHGNVEVSASPPASLPNTGTGAKSDGPASPAGILALALAASLWLISLVACRRRDRSHSSGS